MIGARPVSTVWPFAAALLLAAGLGALQTLAYVETAWWPLPIVTMALLVLLLQRVATRWQQGALLGWAYGVGWLAAGVWWLFISMHRYGAIPAPLAAAAVLALAAALSLYAAAAAGLFVRWRSGGAWDVLLWAALWLLAELARGQVLTGFPWLALGYSQVDAPLAALAPWVGVYGMGAVAAGVAAALATALACIGVRPLRMGSALASGLVLVALALLPVPSFTRPAGEMSVTLLQSNVKQDEKFATEHLPRTLAWVSAQLLLSTTDLSISPETALPLLPAQLEEWVPGLWPMLRQRFAAPGRAALVGVPLGDLESGYTNSVIGLSAQVAPVNTAEQYRYDKSHLVPFGEFVPKGFRWFTELMNIPLGDFSRGVANPPSMPVQDQRVAPTICYEDLFGEELARRFIHPAAAPTVLANISNIGWFGNSVALPQHLNISRLRALEFQLPMVRATNTGATAAVDHRGQVLAQLPPHVQAVLQSRVQGREGVTPFAWWAARWGLWPLVLWALAGCWLVVRVLGLERKATGKGAGKGAANSQGKGTGTGTARVTGQRRGPGP